MKKKKSAFLLNETALIYFSIAFFIGFMLLLVWGAYMSDQRYEALEATSNQRLRADVFTYGKHRYIMFKRNNVANNTYIVHDPACSCNETENDVELYVIPETFDFKGHRYIFFKKRNGFDASTIVHDPDCCHD